MGREKISALVTVYNEEENIRACLESVAWADEIVVVDSYSTDRTPEIAREFTDRVMQRRYRNYADQHNWAIPQVSHPWVLIVDGDERITPALREEILAVLASPSPCDGYRIFRRNHFMGRPVRFCGWQRDSVIRLFRREKGKYPDRGVHADTVVEGKVCRLRQRMLHYTFTGFDQYLRKFIKYSERASVDRGRTTGRVRWYHITLRPCWRFFRQYFICLGFLDGMAGLVICSLSAFSVFLKYARLWERQEKEAAPPA